jgi:two-component system, OmpR family, phosphate regulon sensor histidine kinase PhoR
MSSRLWRGCVVFAFLTVGAGTLIYSGVRYQNAAISNEVNNIHPLEITTLEIRADFADCQAAMGAYVLTRQPQVLVFYRQARGAARTALDQVAGRSKAQLRPNVTAQQRALATWLAFGVRIQALPAGDPALVTVSAESFPSAFAFDAANNRMLAQLQAEDKIALSNAKHVLASAVAWSGTLALLAVLLAVLAAFGTIRAITRPLRGLTSTLHRLSGGDHTARADLAGSLEARDVAQAVNTMADETDRLRTAQEERSRLRTMAREAGFRIREHLHADDVIRAARAVLEENLDCEVVYLHLMKGAVLGPPEGHEDHWVLPDTFLNDVSPGAFRMLDGHLKNQSSWVIQDLSGPEGDQLQPEIRDGLRRSGVVSLLVTPFGVGTELLGIIAASRLHASQPWTEAEVDAVESIAADLGRGLHHARLYEDENRLVEELKAVDRAKSDFVATVSHELRTPLSSVTGYIEMLLDRDLGQLSLEQEHALETVNRNTARLQDLIEDLLTLSAIEAGTFTTVAVPTNLLEVITRAAEDAAPAVASKGLTLTTALPDNDLAVKGDAGQLAQVITNLLSNAVKFTLAGGQVRVTAEVADGWAVVRVTDTGIGIPDADKKDLFTRFFRASNATKQAIPGTGLGLAIVQTIIAGHGGQMTLESQEGQGTTVSVRLPLAEPAPAEPAPTEPVRRPVPVPGVRA